MCPQREQLIAYLYDDCPAPERRQTEAHLDSCEACRLEIAGLRQVRQDLLAWDVPDHGSVWQPFAQPRVLPFWRQAPVWTMAAAASLLLLAGAAGGAVTYALLPHGAPAVAQAAPAPAAANAGAAVTREDLASLEQRVLTTVRSEIDDRVKLVSTHAEPDAVQARQVADLQDQMRRLRDDTLAATIATNRDLAMNGQRLATAENWVRNYQNFQPAAYQPGAGR